MHHTAHENSKLRSSKVLFSVVTFAMKMKKKWTNSIKLLLLTKICHTVIFIQCSDSSPCKIMGSMGSKQIEKHRYKVSDNAGLNQPKEVPAFHSKMPAGNTRPAKVRDAEEIRGVTTFHLYTLENSQGKINSKFNPQVSKTNPLKQRFFLMTI